MTALCGIEKIGDRAEKKHKTVPEKGKYRDENHAQNREDQGVFDQRLALLAARPGSKCPKIDGENSSHERWNLATTKRSGKNRKRVERIELLDSPRHIFSGCYRHKPTDS
jgi:hypothetical protein